MYTKGDYQRLARGLRSDRRRAFNDFSASLEDGQCKASDFSLRSLAENLVEDGREWVDSMNPRYGGWTMEAAGAVSSADFSNITGQIFYSRIMESAISEDFVFSRLVETVPTSFDGEKIPGVSAIGDKAQAISEAQAYPLAGVAETYIETPHTTKRGFIVPVTKEAIFFDRTGAVLRECSKVGESMGANKEKRIINTIVDENDTTGRWKYKGTAYETYKSSGGHSIVNLKASNALVDWTDIDNVLQLFSAMTDRETGEPVVIIPKDIIVSPQLVATASYILRATQVDIRSGGYTTSGNLPGTYSPNPVMGIQGYAPATYRLLTSRYLAMQMATDTSWFMGDVAKAFAYMENWPITVVQAPQNSEAEFTSDIVARFKVSERGAATTFSPYHMVKSTA